MLLSKIPTLCIICCKNNFIKSKCAACHHILYMHRFHFYKPFSAHLWGCCSHECKTESVSAYEDKGLPPAYPSSRVVRRINLFLLTMLAGRACVCGERLSEVKNTINSSWPWLMAGLERDRQRGRQGEKDKSRRNPGGGFRGERNGAENRIIMEEV